ncbi:MAG: hypothetical protein OXI24_07195 [Candidatus Poribacteria bacterium]|nr:hypothetical protein [Candidatus Poribacteria bacterium]
MLPTESASEYQPLGKRVCSAGVFDVEQAFGFNSCLIIASPSNLGSPIVDADTKQLLVLYAGQELLVMISSLLLFL